MDMRTEKQNKYRNLMIDALAEGPRERIMEVMNEMVSNDVEMEDCFDEDAESEYYEQVAKAVY